VRADPNYSNVLTQSLNNAANTANKLSSQLSSGLRVGSLSDDPSAAAQSLKMGTAISRIDTFVQTASNQAAMLQVTDSTLGEVVTQMTSAITLAVQAANQTLNASDLRAILTQATGIRDQVLSLANASYQGKYLFAGSIGTSKPYTLNSSMTPALATYNGDANVQFIETPSGQKIQMNLPGSSIFGIGASGALGALNQFLADLASGASASLAADSGTLRDALNTVSTQRSILNGSLNTLQSTSNYAQSQEAQIKVNQNTLVAADTAGIATKLSANQTQYEALLSVISSRNKVNLFDYLR
jgi:flagellar hook-associated protein 3 FlgL